MQLNKSMHHDFFPPQWIFWAGGVSMALKYGVWHQEWSWHPYELTPPDHHVEAVGNSASKLLCVLWRGATSGLLLLFTSLWYAPFSSMPLRDRGLIIVLGRIQRRFVRLVGTRLRIWYMEVLVDYLMRRVHLCSFELKHAATLLTWSSLQTFQWCYCLSSAKFTSGVARSTGLVVHNFYRTFFNTSSIANFHRHWPNWGRFLIWQPSIVNKRPWSLLHSCTTHKT